MNNSALKTICQLGFRCGQQSSQPATTASGFDWKATRNPQLHIVPYVIGHLRRTAIDSKELVSDHGFRMSIE
jgi:hypothetical protein